MPDVLAEFAKPTEEKLRELLMEEDRLNERLRELREARKRVQRVHTMLTGTNGSTPMPRRATSEEIIKRTVETVRACGSEATVREVADHLGKDASAIRSQLDNAVAAKRLGATESKGRLNPKRYYVLTD